MARVHAEDLEGRIVRCVDLDTGEEIPNVTWADPETGEYAQLVEMEHGVFLEGSDGELLKRVRRGNIELREIDP